MWRRALQILGVLVIVSAIAFWWLLDLYGCEFNPNGCSRILPRPTLDAMLALSIPVVLGAFLIWLGRSRR